MWQYFTHFIVDNYYFWYHLQFVYKDFIFSGGADEMKGTVIDEKRVSRRRDLRLACTTPFLDSALLIKQIKISCLLNSINSRLYWSTFNVKNSAKRNRKVWLTRWSGKRRKMEVGRRRHSWNWFEVNQRYAWWMSLYIVLSCYSTLIKDIGYSLPFRDVFCKKFETEWAEIEQFASLDYSAAVLPFQEIKLSTLLMLC